MKNIILIFSLLLFSCNENKVKKELNKPREHKKDYSAFHKEAKEYIKKNQMKSA